jgi:hypothetical protein
MTEKEKIIKETISIMEKVEDEKVLKDMRNLVKLTYNNYRNNNQIKGTS